MKERRNYLILVTLIAAALVGVALLAVPGSPAEKKPHLGLDLQGGLEVVLQAVPEQGHKLTSSDLDRSVSIMRNRVDKLGVSEPEIRKQGGDQIVIEMPGIKDPEAAANIIRSTAQLQLYDLETSVTGPSVGQAQGGAATVVAMPTLAQLLDPVQTQAKSGEPEAFYLVNKNGKVLAGPVAVESRLRDSRVVRRAGGKLPKAWRILAVPENTIVLTCGTNAVVCPGVNTAPTQTYYYLFKYQPNDGQNPIPQMTGTDLKLSGTRADFDPQTGQPEVLMQFTKNGADVFQQVTSDEYNRGKIAGTPQHFAIVLDNEIRSFPQIDFTDGSLAGGISGGSARITGLKDTGEAKNLALVLQTGALPVTFTTLEQTEVSATLGSDSLHEAVRAAIAGLAIVALFLLLVYRFLGLVAVIGLAIYAALLYSAILLFNVTLTLPGFAGMILTIGVAADANIVIFERIKEEYRVGKSVRAAIAAGYAKGFHTIIDANVVTAITALVLFAVATASVKGFALMLLIGTLISLLTAVAATRAMLGLLAGFRWFDNPRFMGAAGEQGLKWMQIDFMRRRYLWLGISGVAVLISVVSLGVRGLNLGIDFKGGTQITFTTPEPAPLSQVRDEAGKIGEAGAQVQGRGTDFGNLSFRDFQIRTRSLEPGAQARLKNALQNDLSVESIQVKNVSASFGRQIARGAILAIVFSLFLIVLYITLRFQFKFALPVIGALIHDMVITVGVYSLLGFEVSTATVAAVLTVLGYSIYDTIIIFDRIRENIPLMRSSPFATIANVSLWEVMRRSLATTFITLLPIICLLIFGGATLKDFAFALLIGITSGAYSSIFIAAPLLTMWKEREPEYARRKGMEGDGKVELPAEAILAQAEEAAAAEPAAAPELVPVSGAERSAAAEKRERRRQRRRTRPHGRAR